MPPKKKAINRLPGRTLVLDNGASSLKAGFAEPHADPSNDCHVVPNCIARAKDRKVYIADQIDQCTDYSEMGFLRPVEKGCLVNWDAEFDIWRRVFIDKGSKLQCEPHETNLVLAEAPNCPQPLQSNCDQVIFEEFEFASYYRCIGPQMNSYNDIPALTGDPPHHKNLSHRPVDCVLVIDSGYSHTTVTPVINGIAVQAAIRRLDIGGKVLTNYLAELISLRYVDLRAEPYLVNRMKEDLSFVSLDFKGDLDSTWKGPEKESHPNPRGVAVKRKPNSRGIIVDYVLPEPHVGRSGGYSRAHDHAAETRRRTGQREQDYFPLGNERFAVPELLFNPRDIGMTEAGLPEMVVQSLSMLPEGLWPAMVANVVLVGGNCNIPGFKERLEIELRQLISSELNLRVRVPLDPITYTWLGGARMASDKETLKSLVVTREDYLEHGSNWTMRKFSISRG